MKIKCWTLIIHFLLQFSIIRTNLTSAGLFYLIHKLIYPVHKCLYLFIRLVLRQTNAYRHINLLTRDQGKIFFPEFLLDSFRRYDSLLADGHWQDDCKFLASVTIGGIGFAQASFYCVTQSR